jgi:hypothetical protein
MSADFLKKSLHSFHSVPCSLQHSLLVNVGNLPFIVMFKDLQAFWVIAVDSLIKKSSQKEVIWREVWGSLWPKAKSGIAITEEVAQKSCSCICS